MCVCVCVCESVYTLAHGNGVSVVDVYMKLIIEHVSRRCVAVLFSVPLARLQRSEGLQSLVHPSKIPESNIIIISTRHQAGSRGVQAKSRHLRKQFENQETTYEPVQLRKQAAADY